MENSTALTTEQRDAFRLDAEVRQHAGNVVAEMIEIGRCLKEINDRRLYQYLDTATFAEYAEKAVGLKERAAYNYISVFETYGADGLKKYGELGITKLVALAQLNDTDRAEMLESGEAAEISTRELNERIKELKGERDQLRFELDDAGITAKNNAEQIAELKKQLAEAQRPVVASMTDEEKAEFREAIEKEITEKHRKKLAEAEKEAEKQKKEREKDAKTYDKTIKEHLKEAEEQENKIKELTSQLEAATVANAELQARAEEKPKPVIAGSKETLKFCLEDIQQQFNRAVEIIGKMEPDDKTKFKAALVAISDKLKAAAEGIV